jgi:hypothetical protein
MTSRSSPQDTRPDPDAWLRNVRIKARRQSRCFCGSWVLPGQWILWSRETRRTSGCASCNPGETEEHPDPWAEADGMDY